ncbi:MAG: hypothetical protein IKN86_11670 [Bacteroidaceae bacterium]|nr:hypothetical protein [Bacteroidaceae bacterium]
MINLKVLGHMVEEGKKALLDYRISEGLEFLTALMIECDNRQLYHQANQLCDDYANMMRFIARGGVDPQHNKIQDNIIRTGLRTIDAAHRSIRIYQNLDKYGTTYNMMVQVHGRDAYIILQKLWNKMKDSPMHYDVEDQIFNCLWTSESFTPAQTAEMYEFITAQHTLIQQHWISALALSLWEYMDTEKMTLMSMLTASDDPYIRARALTGYALAMMRHKEELRFFPSQGQTLLNKRAGKEMILIQKNLILSIRSEKANEKMEKDLLPNVMKIFGNDYERLKLGLGKEDKKAQKLFKEIHKLNTTGYDLSYRNFIFASRNKFYEQLSHWFAPFDDKRPETLSVMYDKKGEQREDLKFLMTAGNHCETDKYAICFLLQSNMESIKMMKMDPEIVNAYMKKEPSPEEIYRNIMQCLYRFFYLSPWKANFTNPFEMTPYMPDYKNLRDFFSDEQILEVCKFLAEHEYFNRPLIYLDEFIHKNGASEEALTLMGKCHIGQGNYNKALEQLTKAEILNERSVEILSNIALCYKAIGRYKNQEEYLTKLMEIDQETYRTELALCFMNQGKYEDALKIFYQMEYEGKHVNMSMRSIAWCSLKLNKLETADRYYRKLMELGEKTRWEDYLNAGHTAFIAGNWNLAKERYKTYIPIYQKEHPDDHTSGIAPYDADKDELMNHEISIADINLMRDIVLSKNEV